MPDATADATIMVAQGSAAITWEVAAILSEALSGLGLKTRLGDSGALAAEVPIIIFGRGANAAPVVSEAQARRSIILLLVGPGTQAFNAATGLAGVAAGCFAVSPRTIATLSALGIRAERFVLGYTERWDTGGITNRARCIDIICAGEVDRTGRGVLARIAPELATVRSHIDLGLGSPMGPVIPPTFGLGPLLADARLTLSLNAWDDATLDWATTVRAMCNGSVVIAERAAGYGELVPGVHLLMARAERLGPAIRAAAADPDAIATMAAAAYDFSRTQLAMGVALERLASAVERSRVRLRRSWRGRRAVPSTRHRVCAGSTRLKVTVVGPRQEDLCPDVEIDVICVEHRETGPMSLTRQSLAGQQVRLNLHLGTARPGRSSSSGQAPNPLGMSIAEVRNHIVRRTAAPLVMFLSSGDEVLPGALSALAAALEGSADTDICVPIVALGAEDLVHPWLYDSSRNIAEGDAVQRGYVVRRAHLDLIGPFVGGDGEAAGVDRAFWRRAGAKGGGVALLPRVGLRLWQEPQTE